MVLVVSSGEGYLLCITNGGHFFSTALNKNRYINQLCNVVHIIECVYFYFDLSVIRLYSLAAFPSRGTGGASMEGEDG